MDERDFFGYKHWTLEAVPRCFNVGKGLKNRERSRCKRSRKWKAVVARYGLRIEICFRPGTDQAAMAWEIENISKEDTFTTSYSTMNGTDIRCNFTRGGDGAAGYKHTEEMKERLRRAHLGKKFFPEHIQRLKDNHPMKRAEIVAKMAATKRGKRLGKQSPEHVLKRVEAFKRTRARERFQKQAFNWFKRKPRRGRFVQ